MAEGKTHALAIGLTKMSGKEMFFFLKIKKKLKFSISIEQNKGIAIENIHYLNDGLWKF